MEKRANRASRETWQQGLSAPAGKTVALINFIEKNVLKEQKCRRWSWVAAVAEGQGRKYSCKSCKLEF